jgi:hypothetical protein
MTANRSYGPQTSYISTPITSKYGSFGVIPPGVANVFSCVRPVVFSLPGTKFVGFCGTGFFVQYGPEIFFLTAKHVLADSDLSNLCIYYNLKRPEIVRGVSVVPITSADPDDTDHADIACLYIPPEYSCAASFGDQPPFDLDPKAILSEFNPSMRLYFRGLSPERSVHDYENDVRRINFLSAESRYVGPSEQKDMHVIDAGSGINMPEFDGLSGSPVFSVTKSHDPLAKGRLAGMLLRGGHKSGRLHFVSAAQIVRIIEHDIYRRTREYLNGLLGEA